MAKHVAEQRIHARGQVGGGEADRRRPRPDAGFERPVLLLGVSRPEFDAFGDDRARIAFGRETLPDRAVGLAYHGIEIPVDRVEIRYQPSARRRVRDRLSVDA